MCFVIELLLFGVGVIVIVADIEGTRLGLWWLAPKTKNCIIAKQATLSPQTPPTRHACTHTHTHKQIHFICVHAQAFSWNHAAFYLCLCDSAYVLLLLLLLCCYCCVRKAATLWRARNGLLLYDPTSFHFFFVFYLSLSLFLPFLCLPMNSSQYISSSPWSVAVLLLLWCFVTVYPCLCSCHCLLISNCHVSSLSSLYFSLPFPLLSFPHSLSSVLWSSK